MSALVAGLYTATFIMLITASLYLISSVFSRFRGSFKKEKQQVSESHSYIILSLQLMIVLIVFSVSYLYRLIFNFIQVFDFSLIVNLQRNNLFGYSLLIFFLYFVGECIPLTLILGFQYLNHRQVVKKQREIAAKRNSSAKKKEEEPNKEGLIQSHTAISILPKEEIINEQ